MNSNNTPCISIIGIGHILLDIVYKLNDKMIDKYNLVYNGTSISNSKSKDLFYEIEKCNCMRLTGGSIVNSIRTLNWILKHTCSESNLYKVSLLGSVGSDEFGKNIIDSLKKEGINCLVDIIPKQSTSKCAVGIINDARCLLADINASDKVNTLFIKSMIKEVVNHNTLVVEGYFADKDCFSACKYIIDEYIDYHKLNELNNISSNKNICLSLSSATNVVKKFENIFYLVQRSNIIFGNKDEFLALIKMVQNKLNKYCQYFTNKDLVKYLFENISFINTKTNKLFIISNGNMPVTISSYNYVNNTIDYYKEVKVLSINKENIVDTNGAGDALLAGFLAEYVRDCKKDYSKCISMGIYASYEILQKTGCQLPNTFNYNKFFQ